MKITVASRERIEQEQTNPVDQIKKHETRHRPRSHTIQIYNRNHKPVSKAVDEKFVHQIAHYPVHERNHGYKPKRCDLHEDTVGEFEEFRSNRGEEDRLRGWWGVDRRRGSQEP